MRNSDLELSVLFGFQLARYPAVRAPEAMQQSPGGNSHPESLRSG